MDEREEQPDPGAESALTRWARERVAILTTAGILAFLVAVLILISVLHPR